MYIEYNPNPRGKRTGDCVIRAVAKVTGQDWEQAYINIAALGYEMADMPSTNAVWGAYLRNAGFIRDAIPNTCPDCYTVRNFCADHPTGEFAVASFRLAENSVPISSYLVLKLYSSDIMRSTKKFAK